MAENPIHNDHFSDDEAFLQAQFEALDIPPNIDPRLLTLWLQREQDEIGRKKGTLIKSPKTYGRGLGRLFAAYIGIVVMCLTVVLGIIQHLEPTALLQTTCIVFLVYTIFGYFVGIIAEHCVGDSVETLLRDIVHRSRERQENKRSK